MTKPAAPEDVRNVCASYTELGISWTYTGDNPDRFELYSEPMGQPPALIVTVPGDRREYVILGPDPLDPRPGVLFSPVLYAITDDTPSDGVRFTALPRPPRNPVPPSGLSLRVWPDSGYAVIGFNYDPDTTTPATGFTLEELGPNGWTGIAAAPPISAPDTSGEFVFTSDPLIAHTWHVVATYDDGRRAASGIIGSSAI